MAQIKTNTTDLQTILNTVKSLPSAGSGSGGVDTTVSADKAATAIDIAEGKIAYVNGVEVKGEISEAPSEYTLPLNRSGLGGTVGDTQFEVHGVQESDMLVRSGTQINTIVYIDQALGDAETSDVAEGKFFTSAAGFRARGTKVTPTIHTGSSAPSESLGSNGDIYFVV